MKAPSGTKTKAYRDRRKSRRSDDSTRPEVIEVPIGVARYTATIRLSRDGQKWHYAYDVIGPSFGRSSPGRGSDGHPDRDMAIAAACAKIGDVLKEQKQFIRGNAVAVDSLIMAGRNVAAFAMRALGAEPFAKAVDLPKKSTGKASGTQLVPARPSSPPAPRPPRTPRLASPVSPATVIAVSSEAAGPLTAKESRQLQLEESRIKEAGEDGRRASLEMGCALIHIRDGRLYREKFERFEDYLVVIGFANKSTAYRLMDAAEIDELMGAQPKQLKITFEHESQYRPLKGLDGSEISMVLERVAERVGLGADKRRHVTAELLAEVVAEEFPQRRKPRNTPTTRNGETALAEPVAPGASESDEVSSLPPRPIGNGTMSLHGARGPMCLEKYAVKGTSFEAAISRVVSVVTDLATVWDGNQQRLALADMLRDLANWVDIGSPVLAKKPR